MNERAHRANPYRGEAGRAPVLVRVLVFLMMFASLGLLVWYVAGHPLHFRIGKSGHALSVKPAELDFGQPEPGHAVAKTVTVANRTRDLIEIQFIEISSASFRLKDDVRNVEMPPRSKLELTVIYDAALGGVSEGEMLLRVRGKTAPDIAVPLRGETQLPRLVLSASSLGFGEVPGRDGARLPLKLRNAGTRGLKLSAITVEGQGFSLTKPFKAGSLGPNHTYTIEVAFVPAKQGASQGRLVVASNDPTRPEIVVELTGSYGSAALLEHRKDQARALLNEAKTDLKTAYTYLSYRSTNRLLMIQRHQMGKNILDRAWPKYERANELLRAIDPALEDREYYLDENGRLGHR